MSEAVPKDILGALQGRGMLHCNPSQEEVAPFPSGAMGSRNSGGRMGLARPRLAALHFAQGSTAGPKSFCRHGRKENVGSRSCGTGQPSRHGSSAAGHGPCGCYFGRGSGHPSAEVETEMAGSTAQLVGPDPHTEHSSVTVAQHTRAPDIWHSWAAAPQSGGNPAPRPTGYRSPAALGRKWANSKTTTIIIIKKDVNDPAPCPVAPGHPREQGMLQSQGKWRHRDFPANAGSRLYCTFASYIFL